MNWPILIFGQKHFLCAPIGSEHGQENVGISSCILNVTCGNRDWINNLKKIQYTEIQIQFLCNTLTECFPTLHILGAVTHFADNVDRAGVQHIEQSGSQTISPVFSQPALTWKDVLDTFGWHGNRQLIHQPAALWCDTIMAKLRGKRRERRWRGNLYITWFLFDLGTSRINYCWARMVLLKF